MSLAFPNFPLFKNILDYAKDENHGDSIDDIRMNTSFTYRELIHAVAKLRLELLNGKRYSRNILCTKGIPDIDIIFAVIVH